MYRIGDLVFCQDLGLCEIKNIYPASCDQLSYDVLPFGEDQKAQTILFHQIRRHAMGKKEAQEAIDRMAYIPTLQAPSDKVRREVYEACLETCDPIEWIKVIKSAYLRGQAGHVKDFELEMSRKAKGYLHRELSVVLDIPLDELDAHILKVLAADW